MVKVKQLITQLMMDIIINGLVYASILIVSSYWEPPWRGFFCSDISIMYPRNTPLIDSKLFYRTAFSIPILIVLLNSSLNFFCNRNKCSTTYRSLIIDVYKVLSMYILGFNASCLSATIAKKSVGRLRPNFYATCEPNITCNDTSPYTYIGNYTCAMDSYIARNSFPSQHSTVSFYVAVFVMKRSLRKSTTLFCIKHLVQIFVLQVAWMISIMRIRNFFHHETDVLAGIMIGTIWAVITIKFFLKLEKQNVLNDEETIPFNGRVGCSLQLKETNNCSKSTVSCNKVTSLGLSS